MIHEGERNMGRNVQNAEKCTDVGQNYQNNVKKLKLQSLENWLQEISCCIQVTLNFNICNLKKC